MKSIEERDTDITNPIQSFSGGDINSDSDFEDGSMSSILVTQRRPTFLDAAGTGSTAPPAPPVSAQSRPLSQLFACVEDNDGEESEPPPPPPN